MKLNVLIDFFRISLKALSERRVRAVLTIIGISIGPLILVMMGSVVGSYSEYVVERVTSLGQNAIAVFPRENYEFSQEDLNYIRSLTEVKRAEPFYSIQGTVRRGNEELRVSIFAVDYSLLFEAIGSLEIGEGKVPSPSELLCSIVGNKIAFKDSGERCFSVDDFITVTVPKMEGGKITGKKNLNLIISAILKEYGGALVVNPDTTIFVSLEAGERLFDMEDWSGILVLAYSSADVKPISNSLRDYFEDKAEIIAMSAIAEAVSSITGAINFINFTTSLSAFAVAVAGVASTMITSVIERIREIGVMKAIGYTNTQILLLILLESILMSLIGATVGISLGSVGAYILASRGLRIGGVGETGIVITLPPQITPQLIGETLALTIAIGLIGGLLPAYRASKIPPVAALRYE